LTTDTHRQTDRQTHQSPSYAVSSAGCKV